MTLNWTAPSRGTITGYSVLRGDGRQLNDRHRGRQWKHQHAVTDSSVAAETAYVYAIQALSPNGNGAQSETTNVTTPHHRHPQWHLRRYPPPTR